MRHRFQIYCGLLFSSCLLLACNPESVYYFTLINHSTDTLRFYFNDTIETRFKDYYKLYPGDTTNIYELMDLGKSKTWSCDPMIADSVVEVTMDPPGLFLKKMSDVNNWKCETDKKNTFWRLTFEVTSSDLIIRKDPNNQYAPDPPRND